MEREEGPLVEALEDLVGELVGGEAEKVRLDDNVGQGRLGVHLNEMNSAHNEWEREGGPEGGCEGRRRWPRG